MTLFILEKLHGLVGINRNDAEPQSVEARRRLAFFVNSLFMDMPRAPPVGDMMSWSCVTPFYSEDVIYSRSDLEQKNEDGLTTLMYMQVKRDVRRGTVVWFVARHGALPSMFYGCTVNNTNAQRTTGRFCKLLLLPELQSTHPQHSFTFLGKYILYSVLENEVPPPSMHFLLFTI